MGRQNGILMGATKKIQGECCLWDKLVSQGKWEVFHGGTKSGDQVVFVCVDGMLCCIALVDASQDLLEADIFIMDEVLENFQTFIIKFL